MNIPVINHSNPIQSPCLNKYQIISYHVKSDQIVPYHATSYLIISNQTVPKANHTISHQNQLRPNQTIPNHSIMYHGQCIVQKAFKALGPYCHLSHNGNPYDGFKKNPIDGLSNPSPKNGYTIQLLIVVQIPIYKI